MTSKYDLVVIGAGPAGEKGAAQAAYFGKKVAVVEREPHPGGAGINTGTVPSKTLRETALYFSGLKQRGLYGIDYSLRDDLTIDDFMYRKQIVIEEQRKIIAKNLLAHKVDYIHGEAKLRDANTVVVRFPDETERELQTEIILIATGSSPFHPLGIPFDGAYVHDSDTILHLNHIPKTMVIVGGGVIGSEYSCIFSALGVRVILVDGASRLLGFVDAEIAERLRMKLELLGLDFYFNQLVQETRIEKNGVVLTLQSGEQLDCNVALFAAGRQSNVQGLGLEEIGITLGARGLIPVNEKFQTAVPNIYAAGDVIGFPALASTSMEQARVAMVHAFNLLYKEQVSPILPFAIYTIPEISMAGLSEESCIRQNIPYLVGRAFYERSARGEIIGDTSGMVKLIFSPFDKKIVGVHIIGEMASELIHLGTQVMEGNGTIDAFIHAVYNYPTLTDLYKYAAYDGLGQWNEWKRMNPTEERPRNA